MNSAGRRARARRHRITRLDNRRCEPDQTGKRAMTDGGTIMGYILGMLGGLALVILGLGLIAFWVIGTWMNSVPYLSAGIACICVGGYIFWYFAR
jgi:hypothetical protein